MKKLFEGGLIYCVFECGLVEQGEQFVGGQLVGFGFVVGVVFQCVGCDVVFVYYYVMWNVDQFYVGKYGVWVQVVIVEYYFDVVFGQLGVQCFGGGGDFGQVFGVDYVYGDVLGCYGFGLVDVGVVVVLFDGGGDDLIDVDVVVVYQYYLCFVLVVQYGGLECFGVFGVELEYVVYFNVVGDLQYVQVVW